MKKLAGVILAAALLCSCSSVDNNFIVENGICYRVRVTHTLGMQTHKEKVLAVPQNCGLPPDSRPALP